MTTQRVLVTGANGFIGSHLVSHLASKGMEILATDRRPPRFNDAPVLAGVRTLDVDLLTDPIDDLVVGCDAVFHLAGLPGVRSSWGAGFPDYVSANVLVTQRLADACFRLGVPRLVFASSSSVYGETFGPSAEDDDCRPMSPYGVTKLASEQISLAYARRPGSSLSVVALRYFTVYGPRQRPDMAFSRMLFGAYSGVPLTLFGDGTQRREFTYVSDVVSATTAAAEIEARDEIINIGGGASVSMIEAISVASRVTGAPIPLDAAIPQPGDVPATRADPFHARDVLGYKPTVDLHEGLTLQAEWMRALDPERLKVFMSEESR
jgi:nucleoside-diphosphate-sugar epimerase